MPQVAIRLEAVACFHQEELQGGLSLAKPVEEASVRSATSHQHLLPSTAKAA